MRPNFKCIIIDDEIASIEALSNYINKMPTLDILGVYTNPLLALAEIKAEDEIDIALLDIDMPEISGIDLASKLEHKVKHIIFTTGHSKYALQAFGVHAFDYLLKPIRFSTFLDCVNAAMQVIQKKHSDNHTQQFFIKGDVKGRYLAVKAKDIILIYTQGHYAVIETEIAQFRTNETMKNIENRLLADGRFLRVHQSNIINIEKILSIDGNIIHLANTWTVSISESYKKSLINIVRRHLLNMD